MALDRQYIRDYVRRYLDLSEEDLDDVLIDRWATEAVSKVQSQIRRWTFYQTTSTLNTVAGTSVYTNPVKHIEAIWADGAQLAYLDGSEARSQYHATATGAPSAYTVWGGQLIVYPVPRDVVALTIVGYREGEQLALDAGAIPDMPEKFHEVVLDWVMARAMEQQEDPEMSQLHEARFRELMATYIKDDASMPTHAPMVLGGAKRKPPWAADITLVHPFWTG